MTNWRVRDHPQGWRLEPVVVRSLDDDHLTWTDLLSRQLLGVDVLVVYFPSRFELDVDRLMRTGLESFGTHTGPGTLVSFWDPTDPEYSRALAFFDLKTPPALVLVRGFKGSERHQPPDRADLYAITFADQQLPADRERLSRLVNGAHEVVARGDPREIAGYIRQRAATSVLASLGRYGGVVRDELVKCKPKFQLPGGIAVQLG